MHTAYPLLDIRLESSRAEIHSVKCSHVITFLLLLEFAVHRECLLTAVRTCYNIVLSRLGNEKRIVMSWRAHWPIIEFYQDHFNLSLLGLRVLFFTLDLFFYRSKSPVNQATAKATLMQMMYTVFKRMESDTEVWVNIRKLGCMDSCWLASVSHLLGPINNDGIIGVCMSYSRSAYACI
jgi:hypothetical protein